jgi:ABC-type dipeptide/oligopeptide/nickel transport system ATPase component
MNAALERHRSILDFTLSSLARRKAKNLSLLLVYTAVVFALASVLFFTQALRREARVLLRDAPELLVQRLAAGRHDFLPERWVQEVAALRGVAAFRGRLWGYHYDPLSRANYTLMAATTLENVMLPAYPLGEPRPRLERCARELLEMLGLGHRARARAEWLSGGEAQRAAIARALINEPAVIIADEPTAHLDSRLSLEFLGVVARLKQRQKTVIIASHDPLVREAPSVDRVVALRDGRLAPEAPA